VTGRLEKSQVENIYTNDPGVDRDVVTGLQAPTHVGFLDPSPADALASQTCGAARHCCVS
jgi:hypothetical protein